MIIRRRLQQREEDRMAHLEQEDNGKRPDEHDQLPEKGNDGADAG